MPVGSPARHFASRKTGIRVTGNDRDEGTADGEGENFAGRQAAAVMRGGSMKRGAAEDRVGGQSRGTSQVVEGS